MSINSQAGCAAPAFGTFGFLPLGAAFAVKSINALEPRNRSVQESLPGAIVDSCGFDLLELVANPLPVLVIAEIAGDPVALLLKHRVPQTRNTEIPISIFGATCRQISSMKL
ncbi:MAG: hypothetical protein OXC26_18155 [Albidovulum sp.]|nr:hypothetical protein [Albidovulum sp.]